VGTELHHWEGWLTCVGEGLGREKRRPVMVQTLPYVVVIEPHRWEGWLTYVEEGLGREKRRPVMVQTVVDPKSWTEKWLS